MSASSLSLVVVPAGAPQSLVLFPAAVAGYATGEQEKSKKYHCQS